VHCAAGKDRTGVIVALALDAAGVRRDLIARDFMATGERIELIHARLISTPTYRSELEHYDPKDHAPVPGSIERVLEVIDERFGGIVAWLSENGLERRELERLQARLQGAGDGLDG
jgi:protein tyrosine/serine phosphatase